MSLKMPLNPPKQMPMRSMMMMVWLVNQLRAQVGMMQGWMMKRGAVRMMKRRKKFKATLLRI